MASLFLSISNGLFMSSLTYGVGLGLRRVFAYIADTLFSFAGVEPPSVSEGVKTPAASFYNTLTICKGISLSGMRCV